MCLKISGKSQILSGKTTPLRVTPWSTSRMSHALLPSAIVYLEMTRPLCHSFLSSFLTDTEIMHTKNWFGANCNNCNVTTYQTCQRVRNEPPRIAPPLLSMPENGNFNWYYMFKYVAFVNLVSSVYLDDFRLANLLFPCSSVRLDPILAPSEKCRDQQYRQVKLALIFWPFSSYFTSGSQSIRYYSHKTRQNLSFSTSKV